jgi:hypothetical protein
MGASGQDRRRFENSSTSRRVTPTPMMQAVTSPQQWALERACGER